MTPPLPSHYEVLGVSVTATAQDIKAAYRRAARTHHPDHGGDPAEFRRVTLAYEVLSDPKRREAYDRSYFSTSPQREPAGTPWSPGPGGTDDGGAHPPSSAPLVDLRGRIERALGFIAEYPAFVRLWLGEQWRADGAWQELLAGMRAEVLAVIGQAVRRVAVERPLRRGLTPEGLAVALFGASFVTGMDRAAFHPERTLEEATEAVFSLVLGAIESQP